MAIDVVFVAESDAEGRDLSERSGAEVVTVTPAVLDRLSGTENPRGPIAVFTPPRHRLSDMGSRVLVMWGVGDPGNAGTLIRSAAAFGFEVAAALGTTDLWAPKVLRAGAGAHFHTVVVEASDLAVADLRGLALFTVAAVPSGGRPLRELAVGERPVAVLVGDEAHGLPEKVAADADERVTVEMVGPIESLNAAVAGSIALHHLSLP